MEKIYGRKAPIPATWFTGSIDLPDGKQLEYVHMGFASTYERNILLRFENGKLLGKIVLACEQKLTVRSKMDSRFCSKRFILFVFII